jgi:hypothetical protein
MGIGVIRRTHTKFLPKRSYQKVAIKFLYQKVPKNKWLPGTNGSQIQMVPWYKRFPGTNGSQVKSDIGR